VRRIAAAARSPSRARGRGEQQRIDVGAAEARRGPVEIRRVYNAMGM